MTPADIIGSAGVFLLLLAFFLAGIKKIAADGILYYSLNTIGSAMACYASYLIAYKPFIILEFSWMIVSLTALIRVLIKR